MAWMIIWGDSVPHIRHRMFWPAKAELKHDLRLCGLKLGVRNKITTIDDILPDCDLALPQGSICDISPSQRSGGNVT